MINITKILKSLMLPISIVVVVYLITVIVFLI